MYIGIILSERYLWNGQENIFFIQNMCINLQFYLETYIRCYSRPKVTRFTVLTDIPIDSFFDAQVIHTSQCSCIFHISNVNMVQHKMWDLLHIYNWHCSQTNFKSNRLVQKTIYRCINSIFMTRPIHTKYIKREVIFIFIS